MAIEKMQFRSFVFPHNPEKIVITHQNHLVSHFLPSKGEVTNNLGKKVREIVCTGTFFGDNPAIPSTHIQALLSVAQRQESGLLFIPNIKPFYVYLRQSSFSSIEDGKVVPYTLVFVESDSSE